MKRLLLLVAALGLAGCQAQQIEEMSYSQKNALARTIAERCAKQGIADGHPQQRACIEHEVQREVAVRRNAQVNADRARLALAAGLTGAAQGMQNSSAAYNANRPVTCTSTPNSTWVGGPVSSVRTSCY